MSYTISKSKSSQYIFKLISDKTSSYVTRNTNNIPLFNIKHNFYKNSFFPSAILKWNNLDSNSRNPENSGNFKNNIHKFIRPKPSNFFNCCPAGIYLLKVNNRNTRTRCEICLKLTKNTPERRHWRRSGVFIVNFEFTPCSSISIVNFEQVNAGWVLS